MVLWNGWLPPLLYHPEHSILVSAIVYLWSFQSAPVPLPPGGGESGGEVKEEGSKGGPALLLLLA